MPAAVPPLCRRIRDARVGIAGISQEEAARRLGLSLKAYRAYEVFREPKLRRLRQIAAGFGLDEDFFLRPEGEERDSRNNFEAELEALSRRVERLEQLLLRQLSAPEGASRQP